MNFCRRGHIYVNYTNYTNYFYMIYIDYQINDI